MFVRSHFAVVLNGLPLFAECWIDAIELQHLSPAAEPGTAEPGTAEPDTAVPDTAEPDTAEPGTAELETGTTEPQLLSL